MTVKRLSARLDAGMADDLALLTSTGIDQTEAIRRALATLAGAHRGAWQYGYAPERSAVMVSDMRIVPYDAEASV
jgi:hypothetical protein